jgi:ferritin-like metal-binding protein YciE
MMKNTGLKQLYIDELKDAFNAENQLVKALPKMAKAASSTELRQGFEKHLEQTREHVQRIEQIFQSLDDSPKGKKCKGMQGIVEEGDEVSTEDYEESVMDAALISAAQRVEHYEIAAYGTLIEFAKLLGESEHVDLLEQTLQEEKETDQKLTELAKTINQEAISGSEADEESGKKEISSKADAKAPLRKTRRVA